MRLYLFLLFSMILTWVSAQPTPEQRYDLETDNASLESVLLRLTDLTGVPISFSNSAIAGIHGLTFRFRQLKVEEMLDLLLEGTDFHYQQKGRRFIIVRNTPPPPPANKHVVSGYVRDEASGELLIGASVFIPELGRGVTTNDYGFYSLALPEGPSEVIFSYLGYQPRKLPVDMRSSQTHNISLHTSVILEEVLVTAPYLSPVTLNNYPGKHAFRSEEMERLPALFGDADIIRNSHLLPGVQTGADGFGGISVRGGGVDQNMVLLDGVPVYNATHLLGMFSIFNTSAIRSSQLYKGVFPARFGGRLSSVLDVRTKEGNNQEWKCEADLGVASAKASVEGPLLRGKHSLFLGARRSLIDLYSRPISRDVFRKRGVDGQLSYYFQDMNAKVNLKLGNRNHLYASFYGGGDHYFNDQKQTTFSGDTATTNKARQAVDWGNMIGALRWNHQFSNTLFSNTTLTYSRFFYRSQDKYDREEARFSEPLTKEHLFFRYNSKNQDIALSTDFDYRPNAIHTLRFGGSTIMHRFQPGAIFLTESIEDGSLSPDSIEVMLERNAQEAQEIDLYAEDEFALRDEFGGNVGLRLSMLNVNGKLLAYLQPRILFTFRPAPEWMFSLGLGKMVQPLHLLSNSGAGFPRDLWVAATPRVRPSEVWQLTGSALWAGKNGLTLSVEGFYKHMDSLVNFQEGLTASIDATNWQNKVTIGKGWSYGAEIMVKQQSRRFIGWAAYTLAWSRRQFEEINLGDPYPFRFDRRHSLHLTGSLDFFKRWNMSLAWTYNTGIATTLPRTSYQYNQFNLAYADLPPQFPFVLNATGGSRTNDIRLPDYHRLDAEIKVSLGKGSTGHELSLGVYNAYHRFNPLYYVLAERPDESGQVKPQYLQVALFPITGTFRYRIQFGFRRSGR